LYWEVSLNKNHKILHEDGEIKMNIDALGGKNRKVYFRSPKENTVIAEVHGRNKTQKRNRIYEQGTSDTDEATAKENQFNIYAIESYKNVPRDQAVIAKSDGGGK